MRPSLLFPLSADSQSSISDSIHQPCNGLRGLKNLGSTCFMNSVLQAFLHNPLLMRYFLSAGHDPPQCRIGAGLVPGSSCFACELDKLFSDVYFNQNHDAIGPVNILYSVWNSKSIPSELSGYAQQDAHEFFIAALSLIHSASSEGCLCKSYMFTHFSR